MLQQFISILERSKEGELIPFLQSLNEDAKRKLAPELKKIIKDYLTYREIKTGLNSSQYKQKANEKQSDILLLTAFVCYTQAEFEKMSFPSWILDPKHLRKVIDWYCPDWFSSFVNKLAEHDFFYYAFSYEVVMELSIKGHLKPGKQLIVKLLPQYIFENKDRVSTYVPERALKYSITLQEHIWYFFELESDIHYADRWLNFEKGIAKDKIGWTKLFTDYTGEKRIDRKRLLKEALLASNRNFNKVLSGWFSELFTRLEPTKDEITELQPELFSVLSSANSKPVNTALQCIKKIIADQSFDAPAFLDNVPLLLTSPTKATVVSALGILEKLAKNKKTLQVPICKLAVQTFMHANDELQARAAKLIISYEAQLEEDFTSELLPYQQSLMSSAKTVLAKFLVAETGLEETVTIDIPALKSLQPIALPASPDDLVFLASQAFDNNQPWHFDILPAAILKWHSNVTGVHIASFEPALQRALKMTRSDFRAGQGSLDHMLAIFFIDVCIYYCRKFPVEASVLVTLFNKYDQGEGSSRGRWLNIGENDFYTEGWDNHYHDPFYIPHKKLLLTALQKIKEGDLLPLLSTPTHEPGWILPETLVKRLILYQNEKKLPYNIDFQVAVSRCLLSDTEAAIKLVEKELTGENKNILLFLLGKHAEPSGSVTNGAVWFCSSLALKEKRQYTAFSHFSFYKKPFNIYTGQHAWESVEEEYDLQEYDYQLRKSVNKKAKRKILNIHIDRNAVTEITTGLKKFFGGLLKKNAEEQALIYDDFTIKANWVTFGNDMKRLLLLTPNNPEPLLAEIARRCLVYPSSWGEDTKRVVIACLQLLHEVWNDFGEMAHLFLGTCMLASDKTVINTAGEIWIQGVTNGNLNNEKLGQIIGRHESIEFAPLKRFTDLISQNLLRISQPHNKSLLVLLEAVLIQLPDEPIKNLKKLIEHYAELLAITKNAVTNKKIAAKLNAWKQNAGLQKTIEALPIVN